MSIENYQDDLVELYFLKLSIINSCDHEEIYQLRKRFCLFIENHIVFFEETILKMFNNDKSSLCIMSNVGGPYYTGKSNLLRIDHMIGQSMRVVIDDEWSGYISLLENTCGMDNLKYIINFIFESNDS